MSGDMNITRPSTRLHAPPGGGSSISFGTEPAHRTSAGGSTAHATSTAAGTTGSASVVVNSSAAVLETVTVKHPFKVVIVTAVAAASELTSILTKSLASIGVVHVSITETEDPMNIPYLAQALSGSCDGVIAAGIVTSEALSQTIIASLLQTGVAGHLPIVPAVLVAKSLLEAKVLFNDKAKTWAASLLSLMVIKADKKSMVVTAAPALSTPLYKPLEVAKQTSADGLLLVMRESLKKRGADGIFGIGRKFRIMDDDNSNTINFIEFKKAIGEHSLGWTEAQVKQIYDFFDRDNQARSATMSFSAELETP
jgi:calcyphosin